MVLTFAIWNDATGYMNWLDSGSNGPCSATEGNPELIIKENPTTHVVFSNIRWGDIGSTFNAGSGQPSSSKGVTTARSTTLATTKTATSKVTTTTSAAGPTQTHWGRE